MNDGVNIEIDKASLMNLEKQFNALGTTIKEAVPKAIFKVLMKIKTEAQLRLTGRGHIVTSRLKNSMHVKMNKLDNVPDNKLTYSDNKKRNYSSDLSTVNISSDFEGAVGTNVEYAEKVELKDSFLYWALRNVDVTKSVGEDMKNFVKFGIKLT